MGFWRKSANHFDPTQPRRGISRAVLGGVTHEALCQEVYLSLVPALSGKAAYFGVWLAPLSGSSQHVAPQAFEGRFWRDGDEDEIPSFELLEHFLPVPHSILNGGPAVEQDLDFKQLRIQGTAASGARRGLWVPVHLDQELHGILFAASRHLSARFPLEEMERVASELALVFGFRREAALAQARTIDAAEIKKFWSEVASGTSYDCILQHVTKSSLYSGSHHNRIAVFATIGVVSNPFAAPDSARPPIEFRWSAGDSVLARSADSEPISSIWRKALETRTIIGTALNSHRTLTEVSRVVALPLILAGKVQGVMVVGFQGGSGTLATLEHLEIRAGVASAMLAMASGQNLSEQLLASSQFLVDNSSDPLFLLTADRELTNASRAAKALLSPAHRLEESNPANESPLPRRQPVGSLGPLTQLFKPAEWPRLSDWIDRVVEKPKPGTSHSIRTELHSGRNVQLHAAPLAGGTCALLLREIFAKEEASATRAASELRCLIEWIDHAVLLLRRKGKSARDEPAFLAIFWFDR